MAQAETESAALCWAEQQLGGACERELLRREASLRYYYRLQSDRGSWILMDASAEVESAQSFLAVGEILQELGLRVPATVASESARGWLLLEDFGRQRLLELLQARPEAAQQWYPLAWAELLKLQSSDNRNPALPVMDKAWAKRESMRVVEDFLPALSAFSGLSSPTSSGLTGGSKGDADNSWTPRIKRGAWAEGGLTGGSSSIVTAIDQLAEAVMAQPFCLSHRDFHAANLMCLPDNELGVLDFQSAFYAPMTYDIASLLCDCYIDWPQEQVTLWLGEFYQQSPLAQKNFADMAGFVQAFDEISLQRHLKCLGLFVRLGQSGQPQYLDALPRTMRYVQRVCEKDPRWEVFLPLIQAGQEVFG